MTICRCASDASRRCAVGFVRRARIAMRPRLCGPSPSTSSTSVARATDVLLVLGDGPQSLGRIAMRARLTKPTAHRLLASLAHRQMVIQDTSTGDYLLGPGV